MVSIQPEHGAVFKLDSTTGGSLVDYSDQVRQVTPPDIQNTLGQYFTIDDRDEKNTEGGYSSTFSVDVARDPRAASLHSVLIAWRTGGGGARTFQLDAPDSSAGSERYTGECRLQSYTPGAVVAGSANASFGSAQFRCDNGYTKSTIA